MLKRGCPFLFLLLLATLPSFAQDSHSKKPKDCAGVISADGQSFTCDKDTHVLKVSNPAVLQGMEGQHAKVTYRPNSGDEVIVLSASAMAQQQQQTAKAAGPAPHP
jgi:hypothetical protein